MKKYPLLIIAIFWTAIVGVFVSLLSYGVINQLRANSWTQTTGVVESASVSESRSRKGGRSYRLAVEYHFEVAGRTYKSDRVRYNNIAFPGNLAQLQQFVNEHPAGGPVRIFYNPADPSASVLRTGLDGVDFFMMLFLTPFVMVDVLLIAGAIQSMRNRKGLRGFVLIEQGLVTRVRPGLPQSLFYGCAVTLATAFISIFVAAFGFGVPSGGNAEAVTLASVWIMGAAVALLHRLWIKFGRADVIIDEWRKSIQLPGRHAIPLADVSSVKMVTKRTGKSTSYQVWIYFRYDGEEDRKKVAEYLSDEECARMYSAWLNVKTGLAVPA